MKKLHWYIEPCDAKANEALMEYLSTTCDAGQDMVRQEVRDRNGNSYRVVEIRNHSVAKKAKRCGLNIKIFMRSGESGPVQEWKLLDYKRVGRTKKVAVARRQIHEIIRKGKSGEDHRHNKHRGG